MLQARRSRQIRTTSYGRCLTYVVSSPPDSFTKARGNRALTTETPEDFLNRALECEQQALAVQDPKARETLLYVASRWGALATAEEAPPLEAVSQNSPLGN